jgi:rhodanese-related sulfurtransferase
MDAEISPEEVRELLEAGESVRIVDIRPEPAFERGHIPDSENIPFHALANEVERLDGAERVVTVCPHGKSSVQAARLISSYEGVPDDARVESMAGGLDEWEYGLERSDADESDGTDESGDVTEGPDAPF